VAAVTGVTLVKKMPYRDLTDEEFSNTYWLRAAPPGDDASWMVLVNDLVNKEKAVSTTGVVYQRAYGYDSDDDHAHAVFLKDWVVDGSAPIGTFTDAGGTLMAGDQAACTEWKLDKKNARGKWIYLRKYFHHGLVNVNAHDELSLNYRVALDQFALDIKQASFHGGLRPRKYDATITGQGTIQWVTTRTLRRRGKRPRTPS
jgi:hypothetical protein